MAFKTKIGKTFLGKKIRRPKKRAFVLGGLGISFASLAGAREFISSETFGDVELPPSILTIIQASYANEAFYRAPWRTKARVLAKEIIKQYSFPISESELTEAIYRILVRNRNRQGNEELANKIWDEIIRREE